MIALPFRRRAGRHPNGWKSLFGQGGHTGPSIDGLDQHMLRDLGLCSDDPRYRERRERWRAPTLWERL